MAPHLVPDLAVTDWPPFVGPRSGAPLSRRGDELCGPAAERYPIVNGIPRLVAASSYADAFGLQWRRYARTQLDSHTGTTITRDRLWRCLGDELRAHLAGAQVLECGCGAGRFTEQLLALGARVTSVDLSAAVDANQDNFPQDDRHRVAQADITALPFAPRGYDLVLCLGVVQHTPDPERTLAALAEQVRRGGWLIVDHYTYEPSWFTKSAPLFRAVLRRLPPERALRRTEWLVARLLPLHRRAARSRVAHALLTRVSPVADQYRAYPQLSDRDQREWALLDTFDALTDRHKHFRTRGQLLGALARLGLRAIWCEYGGNGVEARGQRP